ncbi:hypothetical protein ABPG75_006717 [Micractinium tetrahymenae]
MALRSALVTLLAASALLAAGPAPAAAARHSRALSQLPPTVQQLLDSTVLRTFVTKVLSVPACLADPALASFDAQQCPGLYSMLDALQLGNTNPPAVCDLGCAQQFAQLSEECSGGLRGLLGDELSDIGRLGTEFFASCDEVLPPMGRVSAAPAPAPVA